MSKIKSKFLITAVFCLFSIICITISILAVSNEYNTETLMPKYSLSAVCSEEQVAFISQYNITEPLTTAGIPTGGFIRPTISTAEYQYWINYIQAPEFSSITEEDILDVPSHKYNCHFYAWYSQDYEDDDNLYWINYPDPFIKDPHSKQIDEEDICIGDIVVYWSGPESNKTYLHSALIDDIEYVNGKQVVTCISKWGPAGLYRHNIDVVPPEYLNGSEKSVVYYRYTQGEHELSIDEDNGESGHTFVCTAEKTDIDGEEQTCSYTTECDGEFTVTSVNSSYHRIYCPDCYYSDYVEHDLYMYFEDVGEYVVKCHDCTYTVECWESPEYYGNSSDGHWVDCPCGCYSFFEPHTPGSYSSTEEGYHEIECADCGYVYAEDCNYGGAEAGNSSYHFFECTDCGYERAEAHVFTYTMIANNVFKHNAYCRVCQTTYEKPHNWVSISGGYRCSDCRMPTSIIPDYSSLSDEELSLLLSSMSEEEIEQFIALLPEDAVARVTAILPPDDEHLTE